METNINAVKIAALNLLYKGISGAQLSVGFKAPQYVYGELLSMYDYYELFSNSKNLNKGNTVFCDLGSGLGKANLAVSACFNVSESIGIEAIPLLYRVSQEHLKIYEEVIGSRIQYHGKTRFFLAKVEEIQENWIHADTIFLNSLTWTKKSIRKIVSLFKRLKTFTEIFTSTELSCTYLRLSKVFNVKMNFSTVKVYLYIKLG